MTEQQDATPLWDDKRIHSVAKRYVYPVQVAIDVRNDYEAKCATLTARIARQDELLGKYLKVGEYWEDFTQGLEARIASLEAERDLYKAQAGTLEDNGRLVAWQAVNAEDDAVKLRARIADLEAQLAERDSTWLAMLREIARFDDEWAEADDGTLHEQFDPWQVLRDAHQRIADLEAQLAQAQAGRWEPVEDGLEPVEIEMSYYIEEAGDDATTYHAAWLSDEGVTVDRTSISWGQHENIRLCRWHPQDDSWQEGSEA